MWRYLYITLMLVPAIALSAEQTLPPVDKPFVAPDFVLKAEGGETHRLSGYRGKVVVLNFWATWCPPCREEMPAMERARKKVAGEDIVILAVNVGEDADTIFEFTGHYPVEFPLLMDRDGKVIQQYPVTGLPTTYIINPAGQVTHRAVGARDWDNDSLVNQLRGLLKK